MISKTKKREAPRRAFRSICKIGSLLIRYSSFALLFLLYYEVYKTVLTYRVFPRFLVVSSPCPSFWKLLGGTTNHYSFIFISSKVIHFVFEIAPMACFPHLLPTNVRSSPRFSAKASVSPSYLMLLNVFAFLLKWMILLSIPTKARLCFLWVMHILKSISIHSCNK